MALILVATRDAETRSMVRNLTRPANYLLIDAQTTSECIVAVEQKPDLIILDSRMGDEDGFTICSRLSFDQGAPVLMILPNEQSAIEQAFAAGATDVLVRPFSQLVMSHRVENLVRLKGKTVIGQEAEWHRSIIENALEGAFRSSPDGRVLFANRGMADMLGYDRVGDVLALDIKKDLYVSPQSRVELQQALEAFDVLQGQEVLWKKKNGDLITVQIFGRILRDEQYQPSGYEGIVVDVTARKQMEVAEREQRLLAEALRDTAAILSRELDLNTVLDNILLCVRRVVPSLLSDIVLLDGDLARIVRHFGYEEFHVDKSVERLNFRVSETTTLSEMIRTKRPLIINDIRNYPGWLMVEGFEPPQSYMGAPIIVRGEVIGFLQVDSLKLNAFTQSHADTLQAFADQAGVAIYNAQLYQATRQHAEQLEARVQERTAELEEKHAQLQAVLDSMGEGVQCAIFADEKQRVAYRFINQSLFDLLGYTSDEWDPIILKPDDVPEADFWAMILDMRQKVIEIGIWKQQFKAKSKSGKLIDLSTVVSRVDSASGRVIGAVTIFRDVSLEKVLEAQKDRFVANAAHELRTPITSLKGRLYMAERQPERMTEHFRVFNQVLDQMETLVEDLLDVARFENGVIPLRKTMLDMNTIVHDVVLAQQPEAEQKQIRLEESLWLDALNVFGDPTRLNQVLTNLVSNAVHYTNEQGFVQVRVYRGKAATPEEGYAVVQVQDSGTGIPAEHLPHIFEPFYRVRQGGKGMGLGLSITKEIVELHGGKLLVESEPNQGTCFTVLLGLVE